MQDIIFVSGWAGYPEFFPELENHTFLLPFLKQSPEEISSILRTDSANILIGWSFGAFCILRDLPRLCSRYKKIILIAPFQSFSRWQSKSELDRLKTALKTAPRRTLNAFWRACNCPPLLLPNIPTQDFPILANGLDIVRQSNIQPAPCPSANLTLVHGCKDRIVIPEASKEISLIYPQSRCLFFPKNGHWNSTATILSICNENSYSKCL